MDLVPQSNGAAFFCCWGCQKSGGARTRARDERGCQVASAARGKHDERQHHLRTLSVSPAKQPKQPNKTTDDRVDQGAARAAAAVVARAFSSLPPFSFPHATLACNCVLLIRLVSAQLNHNRAREVLCSPRTIAHARFCSNATFMCARASTAGVLQLQVPTQSEHTSTMERPMHA